MAKIASLEQENQRLKDELSEKEAQYSSIFFRFESLSKDYLKLKKASENCESVL